MGHVFCAAYTVSYDLQPKLEKIKMGCLISVKFSSWPSPVVIVQKGYGDLRLCAKCKVTINKSIVTDNYPSGL